MANEVDLIIRNGTVVLPGGGVVEGLSVAVDGDRIVAIGAEESLPASREVLDATGKHVLPGFIDAHVHTRAPGYEEKEEIYDCTVAGAVGGITTMVAMFNVDPMVRDVASYRNFIDYCSTRSVINYNVNAVLTDGYIEDIPALIEAGVASFKLVLGYKYDISGGTGRADSKAIVTPDDGVLLHAMRVLAAHGVTLVAHAENDDIIKWHQNNLKSRGEVGPMAHIASRPSVAEEEAISRLILFSKTTGCKVHILHLGNGEGVRLVREAQHAGVPITAETCPHFLTMTNEVALNTLGGVAKTNPPIRNQWDQDRLWHAVNHGGLDTIGTDHAPHTDKDKMVDDPFSNLFDVYAGWPGIETGAPIMFTQVNEGKLSISRLVEMYSTNPAKMTGLYPDRGVLQPGSIADIIVVDMDRQGTIERSKLHSKQKNSPFHGWKVTGIPTHTIINGQVVYADGELLGKAGQGRYVPAVRAAHPSA
ncbi:dihydroorotase family protein [Streptomyces sp. NPDC056821]|uniref:dihydroorotase n=1 Tax=unclassified Streptomyces TaxID=2593676 RepID=UPI0036785894